MGVTERCASNWKRFLSISARANPLSNQDRTCISSFGNASSFPRIRARAFPSSLNFWAVIPLTKATKKREAQNRKVFLLRVRFLRPRSSIWKSGYRPQRKSREEVRGQSHTNHPQPLRRQRQAMTPAISSRPWPSRLLPQTGREHRCCNCSNSAQSCTLTDD